MSDPDAPRARTQPESTPRIDPAERAARLRRVAELEAAMRPTPIGAVLRLLGQTRGFAAVYRRIGPRLDTWLGQRFKGEVAARWYGMPALLLHHRGAKTNLPRVSPLLYIRDGEDFVVVGTNFGQAHHPAWTGNLIAHPDAGVEVGGVHLPVEATLLDEPQFAALWPRFVGIYPGYAGYITRSGRTPRMFRLHPAG